MICSIPRLQVAARRAIGSQRNVRQFNNVAGKLAGKHALVNRLLLAKEKSGKTFDEIAKELGYTNAYTANLFYNQAQLKNHAVEKLKASVPISHEDLCEMQKCPIRGYEPELINDPHVYRTHEAVMHYGHSLKALVNEKFGDGIMSAIDFYVSVDEVKGKQGERRVVMTFNGKFLPHVEQNTADDTSGSK